MTTIPSESGTNRIPPPDHHRDVTGGALRAGVFGAMDGLVSNFALIAGVMGADSSRNQTILTGLAGLAAGAFSMAVGEYTSVASQSEATLAEIEVAEKRGAVAEVDLIASEFGNALAACRARLIGVGASVAPRLSIAESAAAMKLIVDEAIYEALEEISDGVLEFARSPGGDDPAGDPGEDLDPDEAASAADDC